MQTYTIILSEAQRALLEQLLTKNPGTVKYHVNGNTELAEREGVELLTDMIASLPDAQKSFDRGGDGGTCIHNMAEV